MRYQLSKISFYDTNRTAKMPHKNIIFCWLLLALNFSSYGCSLKLALLSLPGSSSSLESFRCSRFVSTFSHNNNHTYSVYFGNIIVAFIFLSDPISWIPHECYIGKECKPRIGSCIKYTEYRECCCDRILAEECKSHFSFTRMKPNRFGYVRIFACVFVGNFNYPDRENVSWNRFEERQFDTFSPTRAHAIVKRV